MGEDVVNIKVVHDKYTGKAAGYCFVELGDGDAARRAMLNVNGKVNLFENLSCFIIVKIILSGRQ